MITWTLLIWFCTASGCDQAPDHGTLSGMTASECVATRRAFMASYDNADLAYWPEVRCEPEGDPS